MIKNILRLIGATTVGYLVLLTVFMTIWSATMAIAYLFNTSGHLHVPSILFIFITITIIILQWSPISIAITNALGYAYGLIPGAGDPSFRNDLATANKVAKVMWQNILIMFSLPLLVMSLWWIPSMDDGSLLTAIVSMIAILIWSIASNTQKTRVWKGYLLLGIFGFAKVLVLIIPMQIYDITGIYPGVVVDKSAIKTETKATAQRDITILNDRNTLTINNFSDLCAKFSKKTSGEIITFVLETYKKDAAEYKIVTKEQERRANTPTKAIIKKVDDRLNSVKNWFTDEPEPKSTDKTIFARKVSPQLGGTPIIKVKTGREYTVKISGRRHQFVIDPQNDSKYFTDVLADGRMPYHGNRTWIDSDPMFKQQLINGDQPSLMAVVIVGEEKLFAHNGVVTFIAKNDTWLKLTANCQQEPKFFKKSSGLWHVEVTHKAI